MWTCGCTGVMVGVWNARCLCLANKLFKTWNSCIIRSSLVALGLNKARNERFPDATRMDTLLQNIVSAPNGFLKCATKALMNNLRVFTGVIVSETWALRFSSKLGIYSAMHIPSTQTGSVTSSMSNNSFNVVDATSLVMERRAFQIVFSL